MGSVSFDLRAAARGLARRPGFTAATALTLGLGIGVNTAVFSGAQTLLLGALPFASPDELVHVWQTDRRRGWDRQYATGADFFTWRERSASFSGLATFFSREVNLAGEGEPEVVLAARCSAELPAILGVSPAQGRSFAAGEDLPGHDVVLLSRRLWERRLQADPAAIGRTIEIHGRPHTVIGVMPSSFAFPRPTTDLWLPLALDPAAGDRRSHQLQVVGRLRPGVNLAGARAELAAIAAAFAADHPDTHAEAGVNVVPLREALTFSFDLIRRICWILMAAAGLVLLVACANVAGLLLTRASARAREVATRVAMGAGPPQLAQLFAAEGLCLALLGVPPGLLLAQAILLAAQPTMPADLFRTGELAVDGGSLAYALAAALATTLLVTLAPVLEARRLDLASSLREGVPAGGGRRRRRRQDALVVAQIGLAVTLLVGSALMGLTVRRLLAKDPGFSPHGVLTARLSLPPQRYPASAELALFVRQLVERAAALPGVGRAAAVSLLPLDHETVWREVRRAGAAAEETQAAIELQVSPDYFAALRVPLRRGRLLAPSDDLATPRVAVVSAAMAAALWGGEDPLGARFRAGRAEAPVEYTVVGVAGDVQHTELADPAYPLFYGSIFQRPTSSLRILLRAGGDPLALAGPLREAVRSLDADLPLSEVRTFDAVVAESLVGQRLMAAILAALAVGAAALALVGLYGLISYVLSQRVREIGIRLSLGASGADVLRLFLGHGARLAALGIGTGALGAAGLAFGLSRSRLLQAGAWTAPLAFAAAALLLGAAALGATAWPAWRAARTAPARALRCE